MSNAELRKRLQAAARSHMMSEGGGFTKKLTKAAKGTNKFLKDTGAVSTVAALTGNPTTALLSSTLGYGYDEEVYGYGYDDEVYAYDEDEDMFGGVKHRPARTKEIKQRGDQLTTINHSAKFLAQAYQKDHPNWIPPAKKSYQPNHYALYVKSSYPAAAQIIDRNYTTLTPGEKSKMAMQLIAKNWRQKQGLPPKQYAAITSVPEGTPYVRKTNNPPRAEKQPLVVLGQNGRPQIEVVSKPKPVVRVQVRQRPVVAMARPKIQLRPATRR